MDNNQNNNKNPKNNKQNWSIIIITTLVTVFLVLGLYSFMQKTTSKEISYSEFLKMLDDKKIEEVVFDTNSADHHTEDRKEKWSAAGKGDILHRLHRKYGGQ